MKTLALQVKNLVFRSKTMDLLFQIKKFGVLDFLRIEFEILDISMEIPGISEAWYFD